MFTSLKNHPFAVEAFFNSSLVLTYAAPKEQLQQLLPECLQVDSFDNKWGFVAVAIVKTKQLRPKGFPAFLGNDFILTGYRIFVRYTTSYGKQLRGLYILKSETDKKSMAFWGNIFTHYNYTTTDIQLTNTKNGMHVRSCRSGLHIAASLTDPKPALPAHSPFKTWQEARRFAGPLPFTFTFNEQKKQVLIIQGVRENWLPKPVEIVNDDVAFIKQLGLTEVFLANAFLVENIPYYWKKGKRDTWKQ